MPKSEEQSQRKRRKLGEEGRASRPPRFPPYPTGGSSSDVRKWDKECDRIRKIIGELRKDHDNDLPTMKKAKDPYTTQAMQSSRDKEVVLNAARGIVSVCHILMRLPRCTGIIIKQWSDGSAGRHHATIVTYSRVVCDAGQKLHPLPKMCVVLSDKTVLDAELIYFNDHYDITLLHINLSFTLELPSIGHGPEYGQEVFVLARDGEASLRVRCGNIEWLEESDILGRDFSTVSSLSISLIQGGDGGIVIDNDGEVRGMAIYCNPHPAVISISTVVKCIDMFMQFKQVARPILGIGVRTMALLDVQLQEDISNFGIKGGLLVDEVYNPVAEEHGIKHGNMIVSVNGQDVLTLPELTAKLYGQLEDYLLTLGWDYLKDKSICMKNVKLRVYDLKNRVERDVTLPVRFYDKAEREEDFGWAQMMIPFSVTASAKETPNSPSRFRTAMSRRRLRLPSRRSRRAAWPSLIRRLAFTPPRRASTAASRRSHARHGRP
uniref:PDZ domain-containing protein n=1 Tax=Leersia perrieri TaxID=77586 RepID=A0A0D9W487_9ORYZ